MRNAGLESVQLMSGGGVVHLAPGPSGRMGRCQHTPAGSQPACCVSRKDAHVPIPGTCERATAVWICSSDQREGQLSGSWGRWAVVGGHGGWEQGFRVCRGVRGARHWTAWGGEPYT